MMSVNYSSLFMILMPHPLFRNQSIEAFLLLFFFFVVSSMSFLLLLIRILQLHLLLAYHFFHLLFSHHHSLHHPHYHHHHHHLLLLLHIFFRFLLFFFLSLTTFSLPVIMSFLFHTQFQPIKDGHYWKTMQHIFSPLSHSTTLSFPVHRMNVFMNYLILLLLLPFFFLLSSIHLDCCIPHHLFVSFSDLMSPLFSHFISYCSFHSSLF